METLRCRIGDLAVLVGCHLPENTGNIVRIIGVVGYQSWYGINGQTFVWTVEVSHNRPLVYENCNRGLYTKMVGPVPDRFLIPIDSDSDSIQRGKDIAVGVREYCERLEALERSQKLTSTSLTSSSEYEPYNPVKNCIMQHPGLTEEQFIAMAEAFGF